MGIENISQVVTLVLTEGLITLLTAAGLIFGLIKQGKLFKYDERKAKTEAENLQLLQEEKQLGIAKDFKILATESAQEAVSLQKKLSEMEINIKELNDTVESLKKKTKEQAKIISEQADIIKGQDIRINRQEGEIAKLTSEVNKYRGIFSKMKKDGVIPEDIAQEIGNCDGLEE